MESGHGLGLAFIHVGAGGELVLAGRDGFMTLHGKDLKCTTKLQLQHYRAGGIANLNGDPYGNVLSVR